MRKASGQLKGRRRSRVEAERLVLEYEQSGMTRKAFCGERGIALHTLDYHRRQHFSRAVATTQLVPGELVEAGRVSCLRVELANGRRIVVEQGFDAGLLRCVVQALEF